MKPQNFEESAIWYTILGTYVLFFLGAQPIVVPIIAWVLTIYLCKKLWLQTNNTPSEEKITIPPTIWVWIITLLVILLAIVMAHIEFNYPIVRLLKSIFKWSREWALWALFPLISCLKIRPQLLYRAACIFGKQSLIYMPICYLAFLARLPSFLYVSPLHKVGGNSADLYRATLYFVDEGGIPRLTLFAPWSPNMALTAMIFFFLASQERDKKWRLIGMIGASAMVFSSLSRLAILCFPLILLLTWVLTNFSQPIIHITTGITTFLGGIFATKIMEFMKAFTDGFNSARASSSELRITLVRMSLNSWWNEARIWGHGFTKAIGPAYTFFYPIGTSGCGTWVNVLYTKGLVGCMALLTALSWSFIDILQKAQKSMMAKAALSTILAFFCFSFIEELDLLAYIYWPGMLLMGMVFKEKFTYATTVLKEPVSA